MGRKLKKGTDNNKNTLDGVMLITVSISQIKPDAGGGPYSHKYHK
jgi:hypothetical protein